jgi:hypothetical protein
MAHEEALSKLDTVVDEIAQMHDARVDRYGIKPGSWIASIETDDWAVTGEGATEAQALSNLIRNARSEGRAN